MINSYLSIFTVSVNFECRKVRSHYYCAKLIDNLVNVINGVMHATGLFKYSLFEGTKHKRYFRTKNDDVKLSNSEFVAFFAKDDLLIPCTLHDAVDKALLLLY